MHESIVYNKLFQIDSLGLLERLESSIADLVYLDPPFFAKDFAHDDALLEYQVYLKKIFFQSKRILKNSGKIAIISDIERSFFFKDILPQIFGESNFLTEIILVTRISQHIPLPRPNHEILEIFGKTKKASITKVKRKLSHREVLEKFPKIDERGNYRTVSLVANLNKPKAQYRWLDYELPENKSWRVSKEKMEEYDEEGRIDYLKSGKPTLKIYAHENDSLEIGSVWNDFSYIFSLKGVLPTGRQFDYIYRLIEMTTKKDDLIISPFVNMGSTFLACTELERYCIAANCSEEFTTQTVQELYESSGLSITLHSKCQVEKMPLVWENYSSIFSDSLVKGEEISLEENLTIEFKSVGKGFRILREVLKSKLEDYAVAFLNSEKGIIYFGIDDEGIVTGIDLTRENRDEIQRFISDKMNVIKPSINPVLYKIEFLDVFESTTSPTPIDELFVLKITVEKGDKNKLYFTSSSMAFQKTPGGIVRLDGEAIQREIIKRYLS
jgi:DNA modification methylase